MKTNNKSGKDYAFWKCVIRILKMAFAAGPVYIIVNNSMAVVNGISQGVITLLTQKLFHTVLESVELNKTMKDAIVMAVILAIATILAQIVNGLNNFMGGSYFKKVIGRFNYLINSKASKLSPVIYEDTTMLDNIEKATMGANNSLGLLFTVTTIFSFYSPYFIFMFVYLFTMDKMLAVALIFVFVPVAAAQFIRNLVYAKFEDKVAPLRRESTYYKDAIGNKETRILGGYKYFKDLYSSCIELINKESWQAEFKVGLIELGMKFITVLGYLGIIILFVRSLYVGRISVAQFAAVYASIDYMFSTMNAIISVHIANLTKNMGSITNFLTFLDLPERTEKKIEKDSVSGIKFHNVSFTYPNTVVPSLSNISVEIKKGETIAIVGINGSGKTTFAKLALGLYEPTDGVVYTGGVNTQEAGSKSLYKNVSAVFQNFQKYKMTLFDNVTISTIENKDKKKLIEVINNTGIDYKSQTFPQQENTMLSRDFDGVELSGGQWQKVAISRGLYRDSEIVVLDEPTAAIDPIEEVNVYKKFAELSKGKTALIITHRLGSARIADRILVMKQGEIVEVGTHDELMDRKNLYYHMFMEQAKWYDKKTAVF